MCSSLMATWVHFDLVDETECLQIEDLPVEFADRRGDAMGLLMEIIGVRAERLRVPLPRTVIESQ